MAMSEPGGAASGRMPQLVVALDLPRSEQALALAVSLQGLPLWLKVGLELFTAAGTEVVKSLLNMGFALFLDLKFHDIPHTVKGASRSATALGAHMTTLHLSGGEAMCRAAVAGREQALEQICKDDAAAGTGALLMGITVLTSHGGKEADIRSTVVERALCAKAWGLDGVVCSGWEVPAVKAACGKNFLCLCPGIRFAQQTQEDAAQGEALENLSLWNDSETGRYAFKDDQSRICTPRQAVLAGADFLVMGRPITRARHPAAAAHEALEAMGRILG